MNKKIPILVVRGGIDDDVLINVERHVTDKSGAVIYMVIESNGGDPSIAYRVMKMLHAKYKKIVTVIPAQAYSAATLMALGSDEIYMRKSACLGPLDTQIPHPSDGSMISSLEVRDTPATLAGLVSSFAEGFYDDLRQKGSVGKKDAAMIGMETATKLINPIAEKIDPIYLQKSIRSSKIGQKYAETLLTARMMKDSRGLANLVSIYLANKYDYHGYAIMLDEAKGLLALNAFDTAELKLWGAIKAIYHETNEESISYNEIDPIDEDAVAAESPKKDEKIAVTKKETQKDTTEMSWKGVGNE